MKHLSSILSAASVLTFALTTAGVAQSVQVVSAPEPLPLPRVSVVKMSPKGEYLSFSGVGYKGLFVMDLEGQNFRQLCSHDGAGWGHQWSPDGRFIAVRANETIGQTKRVAIEVLDVRAGEVIPATPFQSPRSRLSLPRWLREDLLSFSGRAGLQIRKVEANDSATTVSAAARQGLSLSRWTGEVLEVQEGMRMQRLRPIRPSRAVVNAAWSPDGRFSAVEVGGRPSLYVVSADGKSVTLLDEHGEAPAWMNNDFLVYMTTEDDGHTILRGDIWIADRQGRIRRNLTEGFPEIALYPSASSEGTIVFVTSGGVAYKITVAIE